MNKQNIKIGQEFKRELIPLNFINKNDRFYDLESANSVIKFYKEKDKVFGEIGYTDYSVVNIRLISHEIIDLFIEEGILCGIIKILDTPNGQLLLDNLDNYVFRPLCEGEVEGKRVKITNFVTFNAVLKEDDSYIDFYIDRKDKFIHDNSIELEAKKKLLEIMASYKHNEIIDIVSDPGFEMKFIDDPSYEKFNVNSNNQKMVFKIPVSNFKDKDEEKKLGELISNYKEKIEFEYKKDIWFSTPDYSKSAELECINPETGEMFIPDFYKNKRENWFKRLYKKIFKNE